MEPPVKIENADLIVEWFGYWPSFHDSELLSIYMSRSTASGEFRPNMIAKLYAFEMTSEVTESKHYKLVKHCVIEFEFNDIDSIELDGFNHQNALNGLCFSNVDNSSDKAAISVTCEPAYGVGIDLICSSVRVLSLTPGKPVHDIHA